MKREIKFRAWNIPTKFMFMDIQNGVLCENEKGQLVIGTTFGNICKNAASVVMQYTGLKDKNGVEIYEGDTDGINVVFFENGSFKIKNNSGVLGLLSNYIYDSYNNFQVVGNIYENPELLKR